MNNCRLKPTTLPAGEYVRFRLRRCRCAFRSRRRSRGVPERHSGRNSYGRITVRHQGRRQPQRSTASSTSKRDKMDVPATVLRLSPIRTTAPTSPWSSTRRRAPLHSGPCRPERGRHRSVLSAAADIKPGNALPAGQHPGRHRHPQHRSSTPARGAQLVRSAGARRAAHGEGKRHGLPSVSLRRVPQGPPQLHRLHRPGRQC